MKPQQRNNAAVSLSCKDCSSSDIKKRKNYSHGKSSKANLSYSCNKCSSTNIEKSVSRRPFKK